MFGLPKQRCLQLNENLTCVRHAGVCLVIDTVTKETISQAGNPLDAWQRALPIVLTKLASATDERKDDEPKL